MRPTLVVRVVAFLAVLTVGPHAFCNELRLVESSEDAITVELVTDAYALESVERAGELFTRVQAAGYGATREPGLPRLPVKGALLGVPFGADVSLDILSVESEPLGPRRVEPAPTERIVAEGEFSVPVEDYVPDAAFYAGRSTFPPTVAELGFDTTFRHQRVIQIVLHPFQYSAATGELTLHRRVVVRLRLSGADRTQGMRPVLTDEPHWEAVYSGTVLNYAQAREWRARPEPRRVSLRAGPRAEAEAYRIEIDETGMYRLDFASLSDAGLAPTLDVDDVAIYQRSFDDVQADPFVETPLPIVVVDADENGVFDGSDYVIFYAQSYSDQFVVDGFEDRYETGNVYWLGSGEGLAARMEERPGWLGAGGLSSPSTFRDTLHFEEEVYYDPVPASGLVDVYLWTHFYREGGTTHDDYELPFEMPDMNPSGEILLRVKYYGDLPDDQHEMSVSIVNGQNVESPIGVYTFSGLTSTMSQHIYEPDPIPASYFTEDGNRLKTDGEGAYDGADLDWFELSYARDYEADGGRLAFTSASEEGVSQFDVSGFAAGDILAFDVTDPWNPVALTLQAENIEPDGPGYALLLQDDVAGFTRYEAAEPTGLLLPLSIERRDAANLGAREADMIIVSYDGFAAGVERLIAHRESEGFVVAHARLSEVYDEFGGGLPGPQALRNYFMYAFEEWERQPQFVLLVGDASEDTREILDTSTPNFMPTYLFFNGDDKIPASDQWYVRGPGPQYLPRMFIGRLPASGVGQLSNFVSKILAYEDYSPDDHWRNNNLFVADDVWKYLTLESLYQKYDYEGEFTDVSQRLADVTSASPARIDTTLFFLRRYTDPYHGDKTEGSISYAMQTADWVRNGGARADLLDLIREGAVLWNYEGHGHRYQLTHEQLFVASATSSTYDDVSRLDNADKPFIFLGFSCELSRFHYHSEGSSFDCVTEQMMQRDGGRGAVATYACTGVAFMDPNALLHEKVYEAFFTDPTPEGPASSYFWPRWSLGGTLAKATVKYLTDGGGTSLPETFVILGDPLLHIEFSPPTIQVAVDGEPHASGDFLEATGEIVEIVADVIDEVEIDPTTIEVEETDVGPVDPGDYTVKAIGDTLGQQSRWYRLTYRTPVREWSYDIRISAADVNGQSTAFVLHVAEGQRMLIRDVANHPNPFRDETSIIYLLNQSGADVRIRIFTVGGRLIRVIDDAPNDLNYNSYVWDGMDADGDVVASGVYLYVIEATAEDGSTASAPDGLGRMLKIAGLGR